MDISYLGHSSFLLKYKSTRVVCDPFSASIGFSFPKIEADIVTVSHLHEDHSNFDAVGGEPMVINGPGEYEIKGVAVTGINSFHDEKEGKDRGKNVIYIFDSLELKVCHLGDLGHELSEKTIKEIGDIDVLMVPVGGVYTIDSKQAVKTVKQIGPSVVIPMHYKTAKHAKEFDKCLTVKDFIEDMELEAVKTNKFSINKMELPEELTLVVLDRYGK